MQDARDSALSIVKGHRVEELMSIGEEIYDEYMADSIWPGTRALAQAHLDAGQRVWLVTAAPVETATIIARRLGLTGALGTVAESVDGVYTGRLVGEPLHGPAKARRSGRSPPRRASTCRAAPHTATRTTTSRCSRWSATRTRSTPTPSCATRPRTRAGGCATTAPAAKRRRSASRRPPVSAHWPGGTAAADRPAPPPPLTHAAVSSRPWVPLTPPVRPTDTPGRIRPRHAVIRRMYSHTNSLARPPRDHPVAPRRTVTP